MDIITLNDRIEDFISKHDLSHDALALKKEHAIQKSQEWQRVLDGFTEDGRVLRIGIIGRVKAGKSSMLNALLFNGNDILPKAATPMTAALTIMEYSESVRAEVDFFTQQDLDEIQAQYDTHRRSLNEKIRQREEEIIQTAIQRKTQDQKRHEKDVLLTSVKLTEEEKQECRNRAQRQVEREMKDEPTYAAFDQYSRIKATGKALADLEQFRNIEAASVEALMNGKLNQFVGADGELMPFTKSVTLYIPEQGLQGLQIIDTPGINDPVTSRGERTEQLLQDCDVVLIVSPAGQFLSSEDTELMHRITTKEVTQEAYIIASQVDNQLLNKDQEFQGLHNPVDVLNEITAKLTRHARGILSKQAETFPQMRAVMDKLNRNPVLCSSSVAFSMLQRFDEQHAWDGNLQTVWSNLTKRFPETFDSAGHPESAKNTLASLANIDKLHQIVKEVNANKEQILAQRRIHFEQDKRKALQNYLKAWENRIDEQIRQIEHADIEQLRQQQSQLQNRQSHIHDSVGGVYEDLIGEIKLNLDKQLKEKLNSEINQYVSAAENAQGTESETYETKQSRGGVIGWFMDICVGEKTVSRTVDCTTVQATPIRRAIGQIRANLQDELHRISESYMLQWKKQIYKQVVGALREAFGDEDLDIVIITRAVKNIVAKIPELQFELADDLPKNLKRTGKLKGEEAEAYLEAAEDYVSNMKQSIRIDINSHMQQMVASLKQVDLPNELTGNLSGSLQQLLHEIDNKEASLYRYETMKKELASLSAEH